VEVTMRLIPRLFLVFTIFIFTACKEPDVAFVFLENATIEPLQVTAKFEGTGATSKPLVFNLNPGERDGWRFISDKKNAGEADSTFDSISIKSERCERQIDKPTLKKNIRKNGSWILRIDRTLFSC
jgi:hypothetical protein